MIQRLFKNEWAKTGFITVMLKNIVYANGGFNLSHKLGRIDNGAQYFIDVSYPDSYDDGDGNNVQVRNLIGSIEVRKA